MPATDIVSVLRALHDGGVEFAVVGGVAAVLNGAPVSTFDVDIVPARNEQNIERLVRVLDELRAVYRMHAGRELKPDASNLRSDGHHNLITRFGAVDVLGTIGTGLTYEDLLPHTTAMAIADGLSVRVLNLETLITIKEQLGGEKDLAVLPVLRRTLEQKRHL